jgi:hypothetical protein
MKRCNVITITFKEIKFFKKVGVNWITVMLSVAYCNQISIIPFVIHYI